MRQQQRLTHGWRVSAFRNDAAVYETERSNSPEAAADKTRRSALLRHVDVFFQRACVVVLLYGKILVFFVVVVLCLFWLVLFFCVPCFRDLSG